MDEPQKPGGLAITRRHGEAFHLEHPDGSVVVITLLNGRGQQIRAHISAPSHINIVRAELLARRPNTIGAPA